VSQFPRLNDRMGRLGDTFDDVSKGSSVQLIGDKLVLIASMNLCSTTPGDKKPLLQSKPPRLH